MIKILIVQDNDDDVAVRHTLDAVASHPEFAVTRVPYSPDVDYSDSRVTIIDLSDVVVANWRSRLQPLVVSGYTGDVVVIGEVTFPEWEQLADFADRSHLNLWMWSPSINSVATSVDVMSTSTHGVIPMLSVITEVVDAPSLNSIHHHIFKSIQTTLVTAALHLATRTALELTYGNLQNSDYTSVALANQLPDTTALNRANTVGHPVDAGIGSATDLNFYEKIMIDLKKHTTVGYDFARVLLDINDKYTKP